jgi:hypothetical protein
VARRRAAPVQLSIPERHHVTSRGRDRDRRNRRIQRESDLDSCHEANADGFIGPLLAADTVIAPGGLRIRDSDTGAVLTPGCCCGLEDWREWLGVARGEEIWLGHDPAPGIEHSGGTIRLRPDSQTPDTVIELPTARLPHLLVSVQQDLAGFLTATTLWSQQYAPGSSPALSATLDRGFQITAPLPL